MISQRGEWAVALFALAVAYGGYFLGQSLGWWA
jgi:hypothetical protein